MLSWLLLIGAGKSSQSTATHNIIETTTAADVAIAITMSNMLSARSSLLSVVSIECYTKVAASSNSLKVWPNILLFLFKMYFKVKLLKGDANYRAM